MVVSITRKSGDPDHFVDVRYPGTEYLTIDGVPLDVRVTRYVIDGRKLAPTLLVDTNDALDNLPVEILQGIFAGVTFKQHSNAHPWMRDSQLILQSHGWMKGGMSASAP